jgi:hypothetical protein
MSFGFKDPALVPRGFSNPLHLISDIEKEGSEFLLQLISSRTEITAIETRILIIMGNY